MVSTNSTSSGTLSANFTVPNDALLGKTRMRISMKYNGVATACETFSYGEVEDYSINVTGRTRNVNNTTVTSIEFMVFPNPANNYLEIKVLNNEALGEIKIYNMGGSLIKSINAPETHKKLDINNIPSGVYYISVGTEIIRTKKFMKN